MAYSVIALFTLYWGIKAFTIHKIGNYVVETDFYWKYGPAARDLAKGAIDISNYDSKGWGYPVVVAAVAALGFGTFHAGQIVALLSAALTLLLVYRLHRRLFGPTFGLMGLLLVAGNRVFLTNTFEVGTDMFFLALSLGSIVLLLGSDAPSWRAIVGSGLIGGWAFSTRYNGLVLWPGALALFLLFRVPAGPMNVQWRRAGLWSAAFFAAALPWLWINAAHTGNPLTNTNYMNVGYSVYGEGNWEKFFYGGGREIHTFADVVRLDPARFASAMVRNLGEHVRRDLTELVARPWGFLAAFGALLLLLNCPDRRFGGYLMFGALGFLSAVPVFWGARFSLQILPFYAALATWPFVSPRVAGFLTGIDPPFPIRNLLFIVLWVPITAVSYAWTETPANAERLTAGPYELTKAIAFLKRQPPGALIARKPHAAFLAGMRFVAFPDVASPDSLHVFAVREKARYLLISGIEYGTRPSAQTIVSSQKPVPGFRKIYESEPAFVYEVVP